MSTSDHSDDEIDLIKSNGIDLISDFDFKNEVPATDRTEVSAHGDSTDPMSSRKSFKYFVEICGI